MAPHLSLARQTGSPTPKLTLLVEPVLLCWAGQDVQTNRTTDTWLTYEINEYFYSERVH